MSRRRIRCNPQKARTPCRKRHGVFSVGVKGQLVALICLCSQKGQCNTAGGVILHVISRKACKSVLFSDVVNLFFNGIFILTLHGAFTNRLQLSACIFCILHAVVADNVYGKSAKLIVNAHTVACANHDQGVFLVKLFQNRSVFIIKGRLVLCQRAVKIKCECLNHIIYSFFNY